MRYTGVIIGAAALVGGYMEDEVLTFVELLTIAAIPDIVAGVFGVWHRREERRTAALVAWLERKKEDDD